MGHYGIICVVDMFQADRRRDPTIERGGRGESIPGIQMVTV